MTITSYFISVFITILITYLWIKYTHKKSLFDKPNHRSSHTAPIPRGGGIGIVISVLTMLFFYSNLVFDAMPALLLCLPFIIIAITGFLDDKIELTGKIKLLLQVIALIPFLFIVPSSVPLQVLTNIYIIPSLFILPILFLGFIWILNLTNFMDGINGITTSQAIFVLLATLLFKNHLQISDFYQTLITIMLFSCIAFLPFNFPKPKVFLGDIGSLFIGMIFVWVFIIYSFQHPAGIFTFLILFSLFWVDTIITLAKRISRKESIFDAHREHAYQHAANDYFKSHTKTTLLVTAINILWLLPMSYLCLTKPYPIVSFVIAIIPIIFYCRFFNAGKPIE